MHPDSGPLEAAINTESHQDFDQLIKMWLCPSTPRFKKGAARKVSTWCLQNGEVPHFPAEGCCSMAGGGYRWQAGGPGARQTRVALTSTLANRRSCTDNLPVIPAGTI
jgi:hypothetical protein